jgi:hypothetical protein
MVGGLFEYNHGDRDEAISRFRRVVEAYREREASPWADRFWRAAEAALGTVKPGLTVPNHQSQ